MSKASVEISRDEIEILQRLADEIAPSLSEMSNSSSNSKVERWLKLNSLIDRAEAALWSKNPEEMCRAPTARIKQETECNCSGSTLPIHDLGCALVESF